MQTKHPFSYHAQSVTETILSDIDWFSQPIRKFLSTIFSQWWGVIGRYNFVNMSRFMRHSEHGLRNGFARGFDFFEVNRQLVNRYCSKEVILAFDPTFISKSGKHTSGIDYFWNGKEQRVIRGLELGCLAAIDVKNRTAFHLAAIQTPPSEQRKKEKRSLIKHYRDCILSKIDALKKNQRLFNSGRVFYEKGIYFTLAQTGSNRIQ